MQIKRDEQWYIVGYHHCCILMTFMKYVFVEWLLIDFRHSFFLSSWDPTPKFVIFYIYYYKCEYQS